MKIKVRILVLALALMLATAPALAASCPNGSDSYSYNVSYGGKTYTVTCTKDGKTSITPYTAAAAKPAATVCPTATAKPSATKKPTATAKPSATKKPTATEKPASGSSMSAMAAEVVRQTNAERAKQGLSTLTVSSELTRAAAVRAQEIVKKFSHTRPDGSAWSTVSSAARGENIAMGQQSADKVMAAWMSSSGHRANILRSSFGSIGVCAYKVGNTLYWVQLIGG
jgi:uncharacterized protein YkwD